MEESVMIMMAPALVKMASMESTVNIVEVKDGFLIKCYKHIKQSIHIHLGDNCILPDYINCSSEVDYIPIPNFVARM